MQSFEQFVNTFNEISQQVRAQYSDEETGAPPVCHVFHREIDLEHTTPENVDEQVDRVKQMFMAQGLTEQAEAVDPEDLDFTEEHRKLHGFVARYLNEARFQGISQADIAMSLLIVGRRMGLREAAQAFGDITGPEPDAPTV